MNIQIPYLHYTMLIHIHHVLTLLLFTCYDSTRDIFSVVTYVTVSFLFFNPPLRIPLLRSASYRTSPKSIVSVLSLGRHWILSSRYSARLAWVATPLRISWGRAETVQQISEATTVSASEQGIGPILPIGLHTSITGFTREFASPLSLSWRPPH